MTITGTPYYIAPEIFKCEPYNAAADIFSCGIILFEMTFYIIFARSSCPLAFTALQKKNGLKYLMHNTAERPGQQNARSGNVLCTIFYKTLYFIFFFKASYSIFFKD